MAIESDNLNISNAATPATVMVPRDLVELLRPSQWVKNVVVFAGPAAGLKLFSPAAISDALLAFVAFCLAASATYAINDAIDHKADACHATKRRRPVARGVISPGGAALMGVVLFLFSIVMSAVLLRRSVVIVLALYFVLTLSYSLVLKRAVLIDVIVIATGFILRAWAGALAVGVATSEWLVACLFTLCLFMGFGKRRCELVMMGDSENVGAHRRTLLKYTPELLNHLITVSAGITVVTFLLYTMDASRIPAPFHKEHLFYTLPLVVYGVFRFAMLTELGVYTGPTEIVLRDKAFLITVVLWTVAALVVAYQERLFGSGGIRVFLQGSAVQ